MLLKWCESNNKEESPFAREAFQAEWLFLLVDFAQSKSDGTSPHVACPEGKWVGEQPG
jgi:hypothetical protein